VRCLFTPCFFPPPLSRYQGHILPLPHFKAARLSFALRLVTRFTHLSSSYSPFKRRSADEGQPPLFFCASSGPHRRQQRNLQKDGPTPDPPPRPRLPPPPLLSFLFPTVDRPPPPPPPPLSDLSLSVRAEGVPAHVFFTVSTPGIPLRLQTSFLVARSKFSLKRMSMDLQLRSAATLPPLRICSSFPV